ncbi:hypothetical protein K438DRAFT_1856095 [Mycena galopus ATCC 62051]|nr:hypothetical protein K438DRAFT_1856095 [Mycena galopus ATCC 62051]
MYTNLPTLRTTKISRRTKIHYRPPSSNSTSTGVAPTVSAAPSNTGKASAGVRLAPFGLLRAGMRMILG